jgi:putative DNA primase/helicase
MPEAARPRREAQRPRSAAATIIEGLDGDPRTGMCRCPAHDDENPSLHISDKDGKVLWKCFAGCTQEKVGDALRQRGLWPAGQAAAHKQHTYDEDPEDDEKRLRRAWCILRAARFRSGGSPARYLANRGIDTVPRGAMLFGRNFWCKQQTGFDGPAMVLPIWDGEYIQGAHVTFLTPDGAKNRRINGKSLRRMYGPVKGGFVYLGETDDPHTPLIMAEGVETALSASQLTGLPAIAALSANNMKTVQPPPCLELIIAGDNDEAGRKAAEAAAAALVRPGRPVRVAIPTAYNDWNDALLDPDADHEELRRAIVDAPIVQPPADLADSEGLVLTMKEILEMRVPPRQYLMEPWLETQSLCMVYAKRGAGKTRFVMSVVHAIAAGARQFLQWRVSRPARVLYVEGELPTALLQKRLEVLGQETPELMILSRDLLLFRGIVLQDLGTPEGRAFLDRVIEKSKPDIVVLDALSTLVHSGAENEAESWAPIQAWLLEHRFRGRTVIVVHHEGKTTGTQRGTSKREDVMDTIIQLKEREAETDGSAFELHFVKAREFHSADKRPLLLRLIIDEGCAQWSCEALQTRNEQVAAGLAAGKSQATIGKELGLSKGQVSKHAKKTREQGRAAGARDEDGEPARED